nr:helix-turn-helix domain-containing protein [Nocardiopsis akebiae]
MAEPVRARRLTPSEGRELQRIVRRVSTDTVRYRRAMMVLASSSGDTVPAIARLVQAHEDTVREVIHRFKRIGMDCLYPNWAGGRPRLLTREDEKLVVQTATTGPTKLGQPFTRWSLRKLATYLNTRRAHPVRIGREPLRTLRHRHLEGDALPRVGRQTRPDLARHHPLPRPDLRL